MLPSVNQIEVSRIAESPPTYPADTNRQLHPLCQQKPIVKYCNDNGIVVQAYCPIIRGHWMEEPVIQEVAKKVSII